MRRIADSAWTGDDVIPMGAHRHLGPGAPAGAPVPANALKRLGAELTPAAPVRADDDASSDDESDDHQGDDETDDCPR